MNEHDAATKKILQERARVLAQETAKGAGPGQQLEILEFMLGHEKYGIETSYVDQVYPLRDLTPLPGTPPFHLGIISVRGRILSVIDIRKLFDLPEAGLTDLNKVIVIHYGEMEFGILADAVLSSRPVPVSEIRPPLPTLTGIRSEYLRGITSEPLIVLDGSKVLSEASVVVE